jgi:excisionase family DNA binding protein
LVEVLVTTSTIAPVHPAALGREDAALYLALSVGTFEKLVRERSIPQPRQLAGRRVAWLRCELDAWLLARPVSDQLPPPNTGAPKPRPKGGRVVRPAGSVIAPSRP